MSHHNPKLGKPPTARARQELLLALEELYPNPASELSFRNSYQLIVAVILSAQCTDKKVNEVTPILFDRFKSFRALAQAEQKEVEQIIRPINYYKTKAKHLITMAQMVRQDFRGKLPATHDDLRKLPGVGQKTANVIQVERGEEALPVDTHVFRVARRLGLATGTTPEKVEVDLKAGFPATTWRSLHHWLIFHGRRVCKAQRPLCPQCTLTRWCLYQDKTPSD